MGLMFLSTYESLLRMRTVQFFKNFPLFSHSRAFFSSPNPLCIFLLLKMKVVGASTGFAFWWILKIQPYDSLANWISAFYDRYDRMHELLVCAFIFIKKKKSCPKVALLHFLESWWLKLLSVETSVRLVNSEFSQQLTFVNFWFFKSHERCYNCTIHFPGKVMSLLA